MLRSKRFERLSKAQSKTPHDRSVTQELVDEIVAEFERKLAKEKISCPPKREQGMRFFEVLESFVSGPGPEVEKYVLLTLATRWLIASQSLGRPPSFAWEQVEEVLSKRDRVDDTGSHDMVDTVMSSMQKAFARMDNDYQTGGDVLAAQAWVILLGFGMAHWKSWGWVSAVKKLRKWQQGKEALPPLPAKDAPFFCF